MKYLKLLTLTCAGFFFTACSNDDDEAVATPDLNATAFTADHHINSASLPQPVLDYIVTKYPGALILKAEVEDNNNFELLLDNGLELVFDAQGNFLGVDDDGDDKFGDEEYEVANLPQNLLNFIQTNFPGVSIEEAEKESNGNFEVELSNDMELIFNAEGEFLGQAKDDSEDDDSEDEDIPVSQLPENIVNYIAENFPDLSIVEAEKEDDGQYEISLSDGTELKFDAEGNFLEADDKNGEDEDEHEED